MVKRVALLCNPSELVIGGGDALAIAELLVDGQGLPVPVEGVVKRAAHLCNHTELMIDGGHALAVAELLVDGQGLPVPVEGGVMVTATKGHVAEME